MNTTKKTVSRHSRVKKAIESFGQWKERQGSSVEIVNDLRKDDKSMQDNINQPRIISHTGSTLSLNDTIERIALRIKQEGDKPYVTVKRQLELLEQLSQFEFGQFLLQNQGVNGYWTHYMLMHPRIGKNKKLPPLEDFLLNRAPTILATQQRFEIFLQQNQQAIKNGAKLACIPCGMMGELLYLNFKDINDIQLIGIDYDSDALVLAKSLAQKQGLSDKINLVHSNAWNLEFENEFDLISSNGLNIYEPDNDKVVELYRQFYKALKPRGKLVTSFFSYPPSFTDLCEWDMSQVNPEDALLQKIIYVDIMQAKFQCFRSSEETRNHLTLAGFHDIEFIYDKAKIFPTVVAYK